MVRKKEVTGRLVGAKDVELGDMEIAWEISNEVLLRVKDIRIGSNNWIRELESAITEKRKLR